MKNFWKLPVLATVIAAVCLAVVPVAEAGGSDCCKEKRVKRDRTVKRECAPARCCKPCTTLVERTRTRTRKNCCGETVTSTRTSQIERGRLFILGRRVERTVTTDSPKEATADRTPANPVERPATESPATMQETTEQDAYNRYYPEHPQADYTD